MLVHNRSVLLFSCQKGEKSEWKVELATFHFYKLPKLICKQIYIYYKTETEKATPDGGKK